VSQVGDLCQDEEVPCDWVLYLGEFPAKVLDEGLLKSRVDLDGLFADELEALVLSGKDLL
jgi:hypothetical protein